MYKGDTRVSAINHGIQAPTGNLRSTPSLRRAQWPRVHAIRRFRFFTWKDVGKSPHAT